MHAKREGGRGKGENEKKNEYAISTTVMDLERAGPAERARDTGVSRRWPSFEYHKNKCVGGDAAAAPRFRTARQTRFRRPGVTKTVFVQFYFLLLPICIMCTCVQTHRFSCPIGAGVSRTRKRLYETGFKGAKSVSNAATRCWTSV